MDTKDYILFEDEFDNDELPGGHRINTRRQDAPVARKMAEEDRQKTKTHARTDFSFTYKPACRKRHLPMPGRNRDDQGYCCSQGLPSLVAPHPAKYGAYRQGRADLDDDAHQMIDDGMLHAIEEKKESDANSSLDLGLRLNSNHYERCMRLARPSPSRTGLAHNAILMRFVGDRRSCAPPLDTVNLERANPRRSLTLCCETSISYSHTRGPCYLSAYNFLYWKGAIRLIDSPRSSHPETTQTHMPSFSETSGESAIICAPRHKGRPDAAFKTDIGTSWALCPRGTRELVKLDALAIMPAPTLLRVHAAGSRIRRGT